MDNSNNVKKQKKAAIYVRIFAAFMILLIIYIILSHMGYVSKMKYPRYDRFIEVPIINNSAFKVNSYEGQVEKTEYKKRCDQLSNYMIRFVYDTYGIVLSVPKYTLVIGDIPKMYTTGSADEVVINLSKEKLKNQKVDYEVLIIHELFHLLSCQDGVRTRICQKSDSTSILTEGYTDYLTDKFLDYMEWKEYVKLEERSKYFIFRKIVESFFEEEGNEIKFARYYFLDDFSFTNEFDSRVRKETFASFVYFPYQNLEMHVIHLYNSGFSCEDDFYVIYELIAYYFSSIDESKKAKIEENFYDIEKWANNNIMKSEDVDYSYFHKVLYKSK